MRVLRILSLLALCFAVTAHGATVQLNGRTFTLPDGFIIDLAANSPLIERPISAVFDESGHLYVPDVSGSNEDLEKQLVSRPHRVVRLDPADGAGHFQSGHVFASDLMFPEGAAWVDGVLYVSGVPDVWKLTPGADGQVAGLREIWHRGETLTHCGNDLHGPFAGPDGWLYWCKGAFAEQHLTLGDGREFVTRAAHIFRRRPDGRGLEPVLTGGMDNPVGVVFTPEGERILSGTFFQNPANGRRDGLIHALYGGVYGKPNDVLDSVPHTGDLLPIMTHLGPAAASGLARYASSVFGSDYRNNLFVACFNLHKITRHILLPEGATYRTLDSDFLTCDDPDFHPTGVVEDADGSLLIVDTGAWYKICCPTSQLSKPDVLGAIYRVRRADAPALADPRGLELDWSAMSAQDAAGLLGDPRPAVVARAIGRLAKLGDQSTPALRDALHAPLAESRRNAVWALTQIDSAAARAASEVALDDPDESVRHTAATSASLWRDAGAKDRLLAWLGHGSMGLQRIAAEGLGRIGDPSVSETLLAWVAAGTYDRALEHSLIYALGELGDREHVRAALKSGAPLMQRAALFALDQMGGLRPEEAASFAVSANANVQQAAWLAAARHPEWNEVFAAYFKGFSETSPGDIEGAVATLRALTRFATAPAIQKLFASCIRNEKEPKLLRLSALQAITQTAVKTPPDAWLDAAAAVLNDSDADLLAGGIAAARAFALPKERQEEFTSALARIARRSDLAPDVRLAALAALPRNLPALDAELFAFLQNQLAPGRPPMVRGAAAAAFARLPLTQDQLASLASGLAQASPLEINRLLPLFVSGDGAAGQQALAALAQCQSLEGVRPDLVRDWLAKSPPAVQAQSQTLLTRLGVDPAKQKAHLDELAAHLGPGDIRRGQAVFNSQKAGCVLCHSIGYLGGKFGPDLTAVGTVRSRRDLLESIVYPSASFVRSYEPFVVVTNDGAEQSGLLRKDAADEVILSTAPGSDIHIPRERIVELRPGAVSLMPAGFEQILTPQELADLVTFLEKARW